MKKQFKAFWLALVGCVWLLLMAAACHKTPDPEPNPDPDLPPITQTGEGTIGCYINGKPWVPKPYIVIGGINYFSVTHKISDNSYFALDANIDGSLRQSLHLRAYETKVGNNKLLPRNDDNFTDYDIKGNCVSFIIDTTFTNNLTITKLDTSKHIFSGTFEFTACNKCGDTLRFTKGRFDAGFYN